MKESISKRSTLFCMILAVCILIPLVHAEDIPNSTATIPTKFAVSLDQPLQLTPAMETFVKIVLGIQKSAIISISLLVVTAALWIFLSIILAHILELTPFFGPKTRWIGAACITLIIATTGVIETIALSLLSLGTSIWFLQQWSAGALTFIVVVLVFGGFVLSKVLRQAKFYNEKVKAQIEGMKSGVNDAYVEAQRKTKSELEN